MTGTLPALCLTLVLLAALLTAALCAACKRTGGPPPRYVPPPLTPERQAAEFAQIRRHWHHTAPDPQEKP